MGNNPTQKKAAKGGEKVERIYSVENFFLKEYKGRVCSHTHPHTDPCQKFCPTKAQAEVVVNFSRDRGETTKTGNSPSGSAELRLRRSNSSSYSITT